MLTSELTFDSIAGVTYSIAVDGFNADEGSVALGVYVKPALRIRREGGAVVLTWPGGYIGYTVQSINAMSPVQIWSNLPPAILSGGSYSVTNSVPPGQKFFRLTR